MKSKVLLSAILIAIVSTFVVIDSDQNASASYSIAYFNVILSGSGSDAATVSLRNNASGQIWYFTHTKNNHYEIVIPTVEDPSSWSIFACALTGGGTGSAGADTTFSYSGSSSETFYLTLTAGCSGSGQ